MVEDGTRGDFKWADIGATAAPSIGPNTVIERDDAAERLARHEQSETDAMGLDKRREVKGETYGPTRTRVIASFAVFFAIVAVVFVGLLFVVDRVDRPPDTVEATAPWATAEAPQEPPTEIDSRPDGAATALSE